MKANFLMSVFILLLAAHAAQGMHKSIVTQVHYNNASKKICASYCCFEGEYSFGCSAEQDLQGKTEYFSSRRILRTTCGGLSPLLILPPPDYRDYINFKAELDAMIEKFKQNELPVILAEQSYNQEEYDGCQKIETPFGFAKGKAEIDLLLLESIDRLAERVHCNVMKQIMLEKQAHNQKD